MTLDNLLLDKLTKSQLASMARDIPQALMLSGTAGVGLKTIAMAIAGRELSGIIEPMNSKGELDTATGSISVERIRELYDQSKSISIDRQFIIIDDAERMTPAAQAAFLKLLEEPASMVNFILTSHLPQKLLPTVRSRLQQVEVRPASKKQTDELLVKLGIDQTDDHQKYQFIASGLPAEIYRLKSDNKYFQTKSEVIIDARDFLQANTYKKLIIVSKYQANRDASLELIDAAMMILRRTIAAQPNPATITKLDELLRARESIARNFSARLQLTRLVL